VRGWVRTGGRGAGRAPGRDLTVGSGVSLDPIDTLSVTINDGLDTANIDNIVLGPVAEVPESPAIGMFAISLALFGLWRVASRA